MTTYQGYQIRRVLGRWFLNWPGFDSPFEFRSLRSAKAFIDRRLAESES